MDIYQARRTNLLRLIDDDFGGNQTAFAAAVGLKPPQVNRWVSETASEKRRITEGSARHIEERCHKEAGWLDVADLVEPDKLPPKAPVPVEGLEYVVKAWETATDLDRAVALAWARAVLSRR